MKLQLKALVVAISNNALNSDAKTRNLIFLIVFKLDAYQMLIFKLCAGRNAIPTVF